MGRDRENEYPENNAYYIQKITTRMLGVLELMLDKAILPENEETGGLQKTCDLLFGQKNSLLSGLSTISGLLAELDNKIHCKDEAEQNSSKLSDADIAIVQNFISKQKSKNSRQKNDLV